MTNIAKHTAADTQTVRWIKTHWDAGQLHVDDSFQRRFVWQERHSARLIETILLGYAVPEIFVWEGSTDPVSGDTTWSIVDGQQRIRSLVSFINGEFALLANYLSEEGKVRGLSGKTFDELEEIDRKAIWGYRLRINIIGNEVEKDEIKRMFLRLNSTNMTLNPQELRRARFDGEFLQAAEAIANDPVWRQEGKELFTESETRRMRDVQFVTGILIFLRRGLNEDLGQSNINKIYDAYNAQYAESEVDKSEVVRLAKAALQVAGDQPDAIKLLQAKVHLYTLMIAITRLGDSVEDAHKQRYAEFVSAYLAAGDDVAPSNDVEAVASEYRQLSKEGVQKRLNRSRRVALLSRWLRDGKFKSVLSEDAELDKDGPDEVQIIDGSEDVPDEPLI